MDEGLLLSDLLTHAGRPVASRNDWNTKAEDIRARILNVLGAFPAETPALEPEVLEEVREDGYVRRLVRYTSEPDERVPAYVLLPEGQKGPAPAALCLHQTIAEGKRETVGLLQDTHKAYALHLVRRGYVCIAPDHLAAGERITPGLDAYDTSAFYARHPHWSAVGKAIWDARRAVDFLTTLPEVDPARIGVIGHSLGGHGAVFAAAFDERLKACVSNCGVSTFSGSPNPLAWARDRWYVYFPALRPIFLENRRPPFDMHEFAALIAPRAFLTISSLTDESMPVNPYGLQEFAAQLSRLYQFVGAGGKFAWFYHDRGHSYPPESRALAYEWLDEMLGWHSTEAYDGRPRK